MRLSALTSWAVAGLFAVIETGASAGAFSGGFLESNGNFSPIRDPSADPHAVVTFPAGINDAGHIVGDTRRLDGTSVRGFLDVGGTFSTINVPGSYITDPTAINNSGQIVGAFVENSVVHGFLDTGGTFTTIDVPGADTYIWGINDAGQIVGHSVTGTQYRGFVYADGSFSNFDMPGAISALPTGINNAGDIIGVAVPEPDPLTLLSVGVLGLGLTWFRRRREATARSE